MIDYQSTDEEIFVAIEESGKKRSNWRKHDNPEPDDKNTGRWVTPNDIGRSTRRDTRLFKRLKKMTREGKLEMRYYSILPRFRLSRHQFLAQQLAKKVRPIGEINSEWDG